MSRNNPTAILSTASEALDAVLTRLLGVDSSIEIAEPAPLDVDEAVRQSASFVTLTADTEHGDRWAVLLAPSWVPVLSQSVLGEPSEAGDPGADDLLKELATQAYEAVRTRFASRSAILGTAGSAPGAEPVVGGSGESAAGSANAGPAETPSNDPNPAAGEASGGAATESGSPTGAAHRPAGSLPEITVRLLPGGSALEPGDFTSDMVQVSFVLPHADQQLSGLAFFPAPSTPAGRDDRKKPSESQSAPNDAQPAPSSPAASGASPGTPAQTQTVGTVGASAGTGASGPGSTDPGRPQTSSGAPAGAHLPGGTSTPESSNPARTDRVQVSPAAFPELGSEIVGGDGSNAGFSLLAEVDLEVTVELGRRKIQLADVLRLTTGSVIELEKLVGEPLEVYANGRLIAEGEAVVMDEQFGIRITNLTANRTRSRAFS